MSDTFIDTYKELFYLVFIHPCDLDKINDVLLGEARFAICGAHPYSAHNCFCHFHIYMDICFLINSSLSSY